MISLSTLCFGWLAQIISFPTQTWDIRLLEKINLDRYRPLDNVFWWLTNLNFYVVYSVPLIILIIGFIKKKPVLKLDGLYILCSLLLSAIIDNILKVVVHRPRPFITYHFIDKLTSGGGGSFPSGHTGDAFTLAVAVSLISNNKLSKIICFIWACIIAYSRMDLGVHYPTDVLAGGILGALCALFFFYIFKARSILFREAVTQK